MLQLVALLHERPHDLAVALLGVAVQVLRPGARLVDDLLGLAAGLAENVLGLVAGPSQRLVGLTAGVGDRLVGGLLGEGENAGGGVHVVVAAGQPHGRGRGLGRLGLLLPHRFGLLPHRHLGLGGFLRGRGFLGLEVVHSRRGHLAAQALRQLAAQFLVLLDQTIEFGFDLVEEGVDLFFVVSRPQPGRTELFIAYIRRCQRHVRLLGALGLRP